MCQAKYYLTDAQTCEPCTLNCSHCQGPELKDCQALEHGFYYDPQQDDVESC